MQFAVRIGFAGDIETPYKVARHSLGFVVLEFLLQALNFIFMPLQDTMHAGFADGDFAAGGEATVANISDGATSGLWHACLEANDLLPEPFGFVLRMAVFVFIKRAD